MGIRTGEEYLKGIRDGRSVWLDGELVEDVTAHPALAGCAQTLARSTTCSTIPSSETC